MSGHRERQNAQVSERWTSERRERRERVNAADWRALEVSDCRTSERSEWASADNESTRGLGSGPRMSERQGRTIAENEQAPGTAGRRRERWLVERALGALRTSERRGVPGAGDERMPDERALGTG
jgi:hypothetical protein